MFKSFGRLIKKISEMLSIFWNAIGNIALEMSPNKLIGVELRRISGETVRVNTSISFDKPLNRARLVDGAGIPDQDKTFLKVSEEMPQKREDFRATNIPGHMEAGVQIDSLLLGRHANRGDGGYLRPSSGDFKDWSFPNRRPSLSDARDKTKPALVEENQGNVKLPGLFLYAAKYGVSTVLFSSHPALLRVFQVFDGSNPSASETTRGDWDDKTLQNAFGLSPQFSGLSKDQSNSPVSWAHPRESLSATVSGARLASQGVRERVSTSNLQPLSFYNLLPTGGQNLPNSLSFVRLPKGSSLAQTTRQLFGDAVQVVFGFHGVSWNQFIIFPLLLRNSIAPLCCTIMISFLPPSVIPSTR